MILNNINVHIFIIQIMHVQILQVNVHITIEYQLYKAST